MRVGGGAGDGSLLAVLIQRGGRHEGGGVMKTLMVSVALLAMTAGVAHGQLAPPRSPDPGSGPSADLASRAAEGLTRGDPREALRLAEQAIAADDRNPWAHYDRAAA